MHAATKVLNGHSDVVAGVLAGARHDAFWSAARHDPQEPGRHPRALRGLSADAGPAHPAPARRRPGAQRPGAGGAPRRPIRKVARVLYPGPAAASRARHRRPADGGRLRLHAVDPGHPAARRRRSPRRRVGLWKRATSLGGVESLIEHRASIEGPGTPCPPDLLRLSIGIEDPDDLYRRSGRGPDSRSLGGYVSPRHHHVALRRDRPRRALRRSTNHDVTSPAAAPCRPAPPPLPLRHHLGRCSCRRSGRQAAHPGDHRSARERLPLRLLPRRGRRHGRPGAHGDPRQGGARRRPRTASCSTTATSSRARRWATSWPIAKGMKKGDMPPDGRRHERARLRLRHARQPRVQLRPRLSCAIRSAAQVPDRLRQRAGRRAARRCSSPGSSSTATCRRRGGREACS